MSLGSSRHILPPEQQAVWEEQVPKDFDRKEQAGYMLAEHILGRDNVHRNPCRHLLAYSRLTYTLHHLFHSKVLQDMLGCSVTLVAVLARKQLMVSHWTEKVAVDFHY